MPNVFVLLKGRSWYCKTIGSCFV